MVHVKVSLVWGIGLIAETETGFPIVIGGSRESTGAERRYGPTNMELILAALGGCLSSITLRILSKKGVEVRNFRVDVEGVTRVEPPRRYVEIKLKCKASGVDEEELEQAVKLAEKYCPVLWSLKESVEVNIESVEAK